MLDKSAAPPTFFLIFFDEFILFLADTYLTLTNSTARFAAGRSSGGDFVPEHVAKARNSFVDKWDATTTSQQLLAEGGNELPGGN